LDAGNTRIDPNQNGILLRATILYPLLSRSESMTLPCIQLEIPWQDIHPIAFKAVISGLEILHSRRNDGDDPSILKNSRDDLLTSFPRAKLLGVATTQKKLTLTIGFPSFDFVYFPKYQTQPTTQQVPTGYVCDKLLFVGGLTTELF
jgi:hypothetical protein